ncbi:MAG: hypothetical protein L6R38_008422, partial [Xanthoria sp. 2 TBL-2021]
VVPTQTTQPYDLWQRALDRLDDYVKGYLSIPGTPRRDILAAVYRAAEDRKQMCLRRRWKLKKPNGEEIILRDVFDKIITWLDRFKNIGDIAMQSDAGYAVLPWAAVRFLLQVVVSDSRVYGSMVEGLEVILRLILRFAIFEKIYFRNTPTLPLELESATVELYAEILTFLGKATKFFKQRPTVREKVNPAIYVVLVEPIEEDQMRKIAVHEVRVMDLARLADAEVEQETSEDVKAVRKQLNRMEALMERLILQTSVLFASLQEAEYQGVLRWLLPIPYSRYYDAHSENRLPNTGNWLLSHPQ